MAGIISDEEIEVWIQQMDDFNEKLSVASGKKAKLEELRKVLKSQLMIECEKEQIKKEKKAPSGQMQERYAYSDPRYIQLLNEIEAATASYSFYFNKLKFIEIKYNIWRSQQATMRSEINMR